MLCYFSLLLSISIVKSKKSVSAYQLSEERWTFTLHARMFTVLECSEDSWWLFCYQCCRVLEKCTILLGESMHMPRLTHRSLHTSWWWTFCCYECDHSLIPSSPTLGFYLNDFLCLHMRGRPCWVREWLLSLSWEFVMNILEAWIVKPIHNFWIALATISLVEFSFPNLVANSSVIC